jgi:DNA mismatch endonuclease (patch repair protein)
MRAVKSKNTAPEILARRAAHRMGLRFRIHRNDLPGRPDIVLPKHRTVVFVHGCFWHGHAACDRAALPKSNSKFWKEKIGQNRLRDRRACVALKKLGWHVMVLWQCQIGTMDAATAKLASLSESKSGARPTMRALKPRRRRPVEIPASRRAGE